MSHHRGNWSPSQLGTLKGLCSAPLRTALAGAEKTRCLPSHPAPRWPRLTPWHSGGPAHTGQGHPWDQKPCGSRADPGGCGDLPHGLKGGGQGTDVVCHWTTLIPSGDLIKTHINRPGGTSQLTAVLSLGNFLCPRHKCVRTGFSQITQTHATGPQIKNRNLSRPPKVPRVLPPSPSHPKGTRSQVTSWAELVTDVRVVVRDRELFVFTAIPSAGVWAHPDSLVHPLCGGHSSDFQFGELRAVLLGIFLSGRWRTPAHLLWRRVSGLSKFKCSALANSTKQFSEMIVLCEAPTSGGQEAAVLPCPHWRLPSSSFCKPSGRGARSHTPCPSAPPRASTTLHRQQNRGPERESLAPCHTACRRRDGT